MDKFFMRRNPIDNKVFDVVERFGHNEVNRVTRISFEQAQKLVEAGNIAYLCEKETKQNV